MAAFLPASTNRTMEMSFRGPFPGLLEALWCARSAILWDKIEARTTIFVFAKALAESSDFLEHEPHALIWSVARANLPSKASLFIQLTSKKSWQSAIGANHIPPTVNNHLNVQSMTNYPQTRQTSDRRNSLGEAVAVACSVNWHAMCCIGSAAIAQLENPGKCAMLARCASMGAHLWAMLW